MAMITPARLERREYKYLIDEDTAERIRHYVRGICALDQYAEQTGGRYLVDTLYLDTPDLRSYWATVENEPSRFKLRVRRYASHPDSPVFFEIKRRMNESIIKTRAHFKGDWAQLLDQPALIAQVPSNQQRNIDAFLAQYGRAPMLPQVIVRYEREPYFSEIDDYARVTFDRNLSFQRKADLSLIADHERWSYMDYALALRGTSSDSSSVLLELKFNSIVPSWMRSMVQALNIPRLAFCKYTRAMESLSLVPASRATRFGMR